MSESDSAPTPENQRLHPSTLLFSFGKTVRSMILPAAFALFSGSESAWGAILVVLFFVSSVVAVVRYVTLTWRLDTTELVVKQGIFMKSERHVPYARIQNVDLVQNLFHRAFGVADVKIETASGTKPEAVLSVLGLDDVQVLRDRLFRERRAAPAQEGEAGALQPVEAEASDEGEILVEVPPRHLVFLGFVMNRGLAVIGAGFAVLHELGVVENLFRWLGLETWVESLIEAGWVGALLSLLLLALIGLVVVFGLSIFWSLLRFWGFTLRAKGDDLQLSCGLFTRVSASIPRQRIQSLTISASWLHRRFHLASIEAQTAGGSAEDEGANLVRRRFVPVLPAANVPQVVTNAVPRITVDIADWQPISKTAARRMRRRSLIVAGIFVGILGVPFSIWGSAWGLLLAIPVAAFVWWWGGEAAQRARFARTEWGIAWQRGVFTSKTTLLPEDKVQTVRLESSPFDRRYDHVTLLVDAAGGGKGSTEVRIRYLDRSVAEALFGDLAIAAASTEYQLRSATL